MLDQYLTSMGVPSLGLYLFLLIWGPTSKALQLNSGWKLVATSEDDLNGTSDTGPGLRAGAALWTDATGHAWFFGGRGPAAAANATQLWADLWLYDAQLQTWQRRIPHRGTAVGRELACMCGAADGTIAIFGGRTDNGSTTGELLVLHHGQSLFQRRVCSGTCPAGRYDALTWCDARAMHIEGGFDADDRPLADAWTLDFGTLAWTAAKPPPTRCNGTVPPPQLWQEPGGALYLMCNDASTNAQLWAGSTSGTWRLEAESGHGVITWPGLRHHGGACVGAGGDLWLFGGQSQIGELRYLNNDVWTYSIASHAWLKAELPSDAEEPAQRHLVASFCSAGAMWVFGGASCHDASIADCLMGDLWMLNVSLVPDATKVNESLVPGAVKASVRLVPGAIKGNVSLVPGVVKANVSLVPGAVKANVSLAPGAVKANVSLVSGAVRANVSLVPGAVRANVSLVPSAVKANVSLVPSAVKANVSLDPGTARTNIILAPNITKRNYSVDDSQTTSTDAITEPPSRPKMGLGGGHILDSGGQLRSEIPSLHSAAAAEPVPEGIDHGAYGSIIFFGISLSMFAAFGLIIFFRRCVSCPPRDSGLLKEAPPVRYTVIPDDAYSI